MNRCVLKFFFFFLLAACGGSGEGSGGDIDSTTFDPDVSDSVDPSGLPTMTDVDGTTIAVSCAADATTTYGLAEIDCQGGSETYYFACDCGSVVLGFNSTGLAWKLECASADIVCNGDGGWPMDESTVEECAQRVTSTNIGWHADGRAEGCGDDGTETQTVNGDISTTDSLGYVDDGSGVPLYYDSYSVEAVAGQTITLSLEALDSGGFNGYLSLYSFDAFDPNELYGRNGLGGASVDYSEGSAFSLDMFDVSAIIDTSGTYLIIISAFSNMFESLESSATLDYTLTWTVE